MSTISVTWSGDGKEWIPCNDRLPRHNQRVAVLATSKTYQSGYLQTLAGWFKEKYYDTTINRFLLIGTRYDDQWHVTHWMPLPETPRNLDPFDAEFAKLYEWEKRLPPPAREQL